MEPSLNQAQPQPPHPVGAVREPPEHRNPTTQMETPGHDSKNPSRRSIRLQGHDYSQTGAYFITLCTRTQESLFGDIVDGSMRLNATGLIVAESWKWLATQYNHVELDEWVIMPNHLHGIIVITEDTLQIDEIDQTAVTSNTASTPTINPSCRGGSRTARTAQRKPKGGLIGAFKTVSTKRINEHQATMGAGIWQRNYYEHIIRNEPELSSIREYMQNDPMQWEMDSLYDKRLPY